MALKSRLSCLNFKNSLKDKGNILISKNLPINSVGISSSDIFEEDPEIKILIFWLSYTLLSHLLQLGILCNSSKNKYFIFLLKISSAIGSRLLKKSVFKGILSSSKLICTISSRE